jgi:hypothetical protein
LQTKSTEYTTQYYNKNSIDFQHNHNSFYSLIYLRKLTNTINLRIKVINEAQLSITGLIQKQKENFLFFPKIFFKVIKQYKLLL